ncbi:MAG: NRAMP family divalent metal transporter, partial [Chloroflexota bacterium]
SQYLSVPIAAGLLIVSAVTGSFRRWERIMYFLVATNFVAIPLAFMAHPAAGPLFHGAFVPGVQGGLNATSLLLIIAMVGTTVAPWQLFFQQSNVIDKRLTPRWMAYERADTAIGSVVVILGAAALIVATAFAFKGTHLAGQFSDAGAAATGLSHQLGQGAGTLFAIALLNASLIGAAAVTLSTTYAFGDVFGIKHSLHRSWTDARGFYAGYSALVLAAAGIVLIPNAPLGLITMAVQAWAGILLPSATVFLLLLCNDRAVLGPWVNRAWVNVVAATIVGILVMLSLILAVTTLFPDVDVRRLTLILAVILGNGLLLAGLLSWRQHRACGYAKGRPRGDRMTWRMPPLTTLAKPVWSPTTRMG